MRTTRLDSNMSLLTRRRHCNVYRTRSIPNQSVPNQLLASVGAPAKASMKESPQFEKAYSSAGGSSIQGDNSSEEMSPWHMPARAAVMTPRKKRRCLIPVKKMKLLIRVGKRKVLQNHVSGAPEASSEKDGHSTGFGVETVVGIPSRIFGLVGVIFAGLARYYQKRSSGEG